ncbi:YgaP family membrane protein [Kaarinaea lacus]
MKKPFTKNMTTVESIARVVLGVSLIYSVTLQSGTLGLLAIVPLIAIYPSLTGILGWDPVYHAIESLKTGANKAKTKGTFNNSSTVAGQL